MFDLLESHDEPLSPWIKPRLRRKEPLGFEKLRDLHAKRVELQTQALQIWNQVDAFICPVAPHPVPEIDKYNAASYTSSFVLLDYPAGTVPVRLFEQKDTQGEMTAKVLGTWDKRNRELCEPTVVKVSTTLTRQQGPKLIDRCMLVRPYVCR